MKGRIGIITISNGVANYGNKLQNYAVQCIIENLGYSSETILDCRWRKNPRKWGTYLKNILHIISRYKYSPKHLLYLRFRNWSEKYLKYCPIAVCDEKDFGILQDRFDYCFVGSDQIWNPEYSPDIFNFAAFFPGYKRIALAPSFGVSELPDNTLKQYASYLYDYRALSSRETSGTRIIKKITNRDAVTLIDPTMMLSQSEWDKIVIAPTFKKKYILYFHLGDSSVKYEAYIKRKKQELNVELVVDLSMPKYATINPSEFIGYIKSASLVVTDSFHGSVFSILYGIPLTIVNRIFNGGSMNSRIETLLSIFDIVYHGNEIEEVTIKCNVEKCLKLERQRVWDYLNQSLLSN